MSYGTDYRKRTLEYREEGHTLAETCRTFKVSISTIRQWEKQWREQGTLEKKVAIHRFKKIDPEKFKQYIKAHPDAYQAELAEEFCCSDTAIRKAFKRLKITRKKDDTLQRTKP